jgi:hypothetical protein
MFAAGIPNAQCLVGGLASVGIWYLSDVQSIPVMFHVQDAIDGVWKRTSASRSFPSGAGRSGTRYTIRRMHQMEIRKATFEENTEVGDRMWDQMGAISEALVFRNQTRQNTPAMQKRQSKSFSRTINKNAHALRLRSTQSNESAFYVRWPHCLIYNDTRHCAHGNNGHITGRDLARQHFYTLHCLLL